MQPTLIGAIFAVVAIVLMFRSSATSMLVLVMAATLFGGAAAIDMPALGGSSIPPASMALLFLALYLFLSPAWTAGNLAGAIRPNIFLAIFCVYGAISAFLLPRIFAGTLGVVPMNVSGAALRAIYHVTPLGPSSQNITTAVYLLGTLFAALATALIVRIERSETRLVTVLVIMSWVHVFFGILNLALSAVGHSDWLMFLRNGHYAQVDQSLGGGVQRINGIFPEPSMYAAYGFGLMAVMVEFWLRDIRPRATALAAFALLAVLMLTTSSTAYASCGIYGVLLMLRLVFFPVRVPGRKLIALAFLGVLFLAGALAIAVFLPDAAARVVKVVDSMTTQKAASFSGRQRMVWAQNGITAFVHSYGLGIGAGSFRSSSLVTAIAGSMGVIGIAAFAAHITALLRFWRRSAHDLSRSDEERINTAAAWAAVISLIPAAFSAPSPDPAMMFGVLSGLAVARRFSASLSCRSVLRSGGITAPS